jgi:hypothetical protein
MNLRRYFFVATLVITGFPLFSHAQTDATPTCNTPEQKAACQAMLQQVLAEEAQAQQQLSDAQSKSASLSQAIAVLTAKIKAAQLDIKAKNLLIQTLGNDIQDKANHIADLEDHISKGKQTMADLLRKTREMDQYSLPEVLLSQSTVTGFFNDVDAFDSLQQSLQTVGDQLRNDQASTSAEKDALTVRQNKEMDARYAIQQQEKNIESDQAQQQQLLSISKGNEKAYSTVVAQKAAKAAQIRSALFSLAGANAIQFGDAYNYAVQVYKQTGVPPAFLLAILKQETNIGGNVGTCYLTNQSDGSGINTKTNAYVANVMKPSRDVQPFLNITSTLGLDYKSSVVSCPQSVGYGGGMGPAQFIASTWMLLKDRVAAALGISDMPNPWRPADAFMAAGLYLADLGANSSSYTAQKNAACKYYSGRACGYVTGATAYGNSVLNLAYFNSNSMQSQIDALQ